MAEQTNIAVIGGGSWGTALANVFADAGSRVTLWSRDKQTCQQVNQSHTNEKYLKGISLNREMKASEDLESTIKGAEIIVCSIPTQHIRSVLGPFGKLLDSKVVVNTSKGIEQHTQARVSEIFSAISPRAKYVILSGPSFALEVAKRLPTAVTVACLDSDCATAIQHRLSTPYFRAYTSKDVVGVELAGALKNVIAIASGASVGLQLGYNAQAAIINRGMAEILRFGKKLGASPLTFLGLAGMGDLILTCTGPLSRNRKVGMLLGEGKSLPEIQKELGGVAEGVYTVQSALELGKKLGLDLPITNEIYEVIYAGSTPKKALVSLMGRELKEEW